ncbi:hypothetical protein B4135_1159 [Caldibacillus debilis]|uniref:Uncharacterized protein n=1 Tax=Caldibacillus debilis TaxID=301148 RepID=A0A150MDZ4_9BACI|nr:hypothetical protein B4135_1159 [Caldibacillus debilis]
MRTGGKKPDCRTSGSCSRDYARSNAGRSPGFSVPGKALQHPAAGVFRPSRSGIKSVIFPMPDFFQTFRAAAARSRNLFCALFPGFFRTASPRF